MKFKFALADLTDIIAHSRTSTKHKQTFGSKNQGAGLWLVKDSGAYLMSNGDPGQPKDNGEKGLKVVYAKGKKPSDGHIGGDDYVEFIALSEFLAAEKDGAENIIINMTSTHFSLAFEFPVDTDETRKNVEQYVRKVLGDADKITFTKTAKQKTFFTIPTAKRDLIKSTYPNAVIISDLPFDECVQAVARIKGLNIGSAA